MTVPRRELLKQEDAELDRVLADLSEERLEIHMSALTFMRVVERNEGDDLGQLQLIANSTGYYGSFSGAPKSELIVKGRLTSADKDELRKRCKLDLQGSDASTVRLHIDDIRRPRVLRLSLTFGVLTLAASLFAAIRMIPEQARGFLQVVDVDSSQSGFDSFFQTAPMMAAGAAALYLTVFTLYSGMHQERMERRVSGLARGLKGLVEQDALLLRWCLMSLACSSLGYLLAMTPDPLLWLVTLPDVSAERNAPLLALALLRGLGASLMVTFSTMMLVPPFHDMISFLVGRNIDHLALQAQHQRHLQLNPQERRDAGARDTELAAAPVQQEGGQGGTPSRPAPAAQRGGTG